MSSERSVSTPVEPRPLTQTDADGRVVWEGWPPDCDDGKCCACYRCYREYVAVKTVGELV